MPIVSVTRLRLRAWFFIPPFLFTSMPIGKQVRKAPGFLGGLLLMDAGRTFWTVSVWKDRANMQAFRNGGSHGRSMPKLGRWVEHARLANWEQEGTEVPGWEALYARLTESGRPSQVEHPAADHAGPNAFPMPKQDGWREGKLEPIEAGKKSGKV